MKRALFFSTLVVVLPAFAAINLAQSAPAPKDKPTIRLVQTGKVKLDDLVIDDIAVIDDNTVVVVGRKGDVEDVMALDRGDPRGAIVDLAKKSARPFTNEHKARICSVSVSGSRMVTSSTDLDPFLRVWDLKAQKTIAAIGIGNPNDDNLSFRCSIRCFYKSNRVVVEAAKQLIVFDLAKVKDRVELACPPAAQWLSDPIAISPDDAWIACTADRGQVVFWKVATQKATTVSLTPKKVDDPDKWSAGGVTFSPSGKLFAWRSESADEVPKGKSEKDVPADRRGVVQIDLHSGKVIPLGMGQSIYTLGCTIDPTDTWLATVGSSRPDKPRRDGATTVGELRVYNLSSKELAYRQQVEGLPLKWVSFTPNGKRIVCATLDGIVRWWDVAAR